MVGRGRRPTWGAPSTPRRGACDGGTHHGRLPVWLLLLLLPLHLASLVATQSSSTATAGVSPPTAGALLRRRQQAQPIFHIGAVVNPPDSTSYFAQAIEDAVGEHGITLYAQTVHMNSNPIRIAQSVCENLISAQVFAVVISHPVSGELSPAAVSYTCGFYNVPVLGISSRHSSLSDKNLHRTFLRTVPPYSQQADVWVELLQFLKYRCVVFIHSSDNDGRATLGRFQNKAEPQGIKLERVIEYEPGITDITQELEETKEIHCRVFVLYATAEDATGIYSEVAFLNMTSPGYVWIVSEQALRAPNVPDGVLGLELVNASDERAHIRDSVQVIALALKELQKDPNMTQPNISCSMLGNSWESGLKLVSLLKKQKLLRGETGRVRFDDKGDRLDSDYDILNVVRGSHVPVGQYVFSKWSMSMELELELEKMVWPGRQTETPLGYVIPKHLRVATIAERPFVWVRPVADESQCLPSEIPCPWTNSTDGTAYPYCCEGYCMDLLRSLARKLNFTYTLYQVQDGQYGTFDFVNGSTYKRWSGMVGDLVRGVADMIIAPLTITPERSMEIDFTKPFKYQGITILAKKQDKSSTLASFLQPFQKTLWILVMVSVHVVALALYLLDRFSPFGRYKLPNSDATEEDALNLSSAIWFAWGVLLNSGIAEGTPRSFSGRVLGMVWAGFAMIVVASYTANLAAFLVLEKPESSLSGINDPRLRNPSENFTYATVKGSAVDMYFRRQVELSNMYRIMEGKNYETVEEGIEALKNNQLDAFIWDSSRLEFEAAQHCDLVTAGEQFGRSGYGIGLQRNSFWVDKVTLTLLEMHESGYMEQLDSKWIIRDGEKCETKNERTPATLGLTNMAGVFILVGAGIVGGIGLIVIEIVYKKHQTRKQRRLELARHAADKWRGAVEHWEDWDPEAYYDLSPRPNRQGDKEKLAEQPQLQPLSHMWKNLDVLTASRTRTVGTNTEPSFLEIPGSKARRRRRKRPARERSSSRDLCQSSSRDTDSSSSDDNAANSRPATVKLKREASPASMVH
ncbi:glutamate [NMDA] receptor subunit 1-like isoform X1 [Dermacentor albipictus]|uniref:glutamate [NMDA] receptor subunit 1-like isoform X1 n=1 Tax=Dermacentor albipictus TaxID=60249 RepID=UPI0038FCE2D5